jgi:beta-glucosidase
MRISRIFFGLGVSLAAVLALSGPTASSSQNRNEAIYHAGWIDLNKNGRMDVYENSKAPIDQRLRISSAR